MRVVPKGLRAFDIEDAEFFLTLVPGPRDRDGVPEVDSRLEAADRGTRPESRTFSVGLLYGPSGSGKSSLVKAGVLPRLSRQVRAIYVEASAGGNRGRAFAPLCVANSPTCPPDGELDCATAAVRERGAGHRGSKVLLVLDQFEQWLQSHPDDARRRAGACPAPVRRTGLAGPAAGARRLLDGHDPIPEGARNPACSKASTRRRWSCSTSSTPASCWPSWAGRWAESRMGRSRRARRRGGSSRRPSRNLPAPDGRVIPVRLTLFAEMLRHRDWTTKTLRELGGIEGIGETFLEESFSARSAPMAHRVHQRAAQAVLQALLPDPRSDIRDRWKPVRAAARSLGLRRSAHRFRRADVHPRQRAAGW